MSEKLKSTESESDLSFTQLAPVVWAKLAELPRTGWVQSGVKNPETVAEHTLALIQLGKTLGEFSQTERTILLNMLEIHDWPEAIHGDEVILNNEDGETYQALKNTKFEMEQRAMKSICAELKDQGEIIFNFWLRFETAEDEIATFARQLDKFQAVEKALEYESQQNIPLFKEFFDYSKAEITHPVLLERLQKLEEDWRAL